MAALKARDGRDPRELAAMDIDKHLGDRALKTRYVATMFDILAPGYDTFTRVFSFGMDRGWKRRLIDEAVRRAPKAPRILDLACGTGDLGRELAQRTSAACRALSVAGGGPTSIHSTESPGEAAATVPSAR